MVKRPQSSGDEHPKSTSEPPTDKVEISIAEFDETHRCHIPDVLYRRFSELVFAERFLIDGEILIRNLLYYRGIEGTYDTRCDPLEGRYQNKWPQGAQLLIQSEPNGEWIPIGGILSYTQNLPFPERYFVYCFSSQLDDAQVGNFGKYLVTIHNPQELFNRITSGVVARSHFCWGEVKYYDDDIEGLSCIYSNYTQDGTPIWMAKRKTYSNEHEFRIAIMRGDVEHLWTNRMAGSQQYLNTNEWQKDLTCKVIVGDISDIASLSTS